MTLQYLIDATWNILVKKLHSLIKLYNMGNLEDIPDWQWTSVIDSHSKIMGHNF